MVEKAVHNFSSNTSGEFRSMFEDKVLAIAKNFDDTLAINALGGDVESAFSAVREGDVVHLMYPQHVNDGDLLGGLITLLATQIPTCVVHPGTASWSEPEWSAESRRHLAGLVSGIREVPHSFTHTSSPADLARISLWVTACASALSRPGGVKTAHGAVLPPSIGGAKSASRYLLRVVQGLRASVTDDSAGKGIDTLVLLIKLWQKTQEDKALDLVRKHKISWSDVLFKGAPTTVIKGKKGKPDQTVVKSPPKPSRSPWLSSAERSVLGEVFKARWSALEDIRNQWSVLIAEQQHRQYETFVGRVRAHYEELNRISMSVNARLGKRKYWIESVCKSDGYNPKVKRDESQSFLLSAHFFKKDLSGVTNGIKRVFAPITYLEDDSFKSREIWDKCLIEHGPLTPINVSDFTLDGDGQAYKLWQLWAEMFRPALSGIGLKVDEPQPIETYNIFSKLPEQGA